MGGCLSTLTPTSHLPNYANRSDEDTDAVDESRCVLCVMVDREHEVTGGMEIDVAEVDIM